MELVRNIAQFKLLDHCLSFKAGNNLRDMLFTPRNHILRTKYHKVKNTSDEKKREKQTSTRTCTYRRRKKYLSKSQKHIGKFKQKRLDASQKQKCVPVSIS